MKSRLFAAVAAFVVAIGGLAAGPAHADEDPQILHCYLNGSTFQYFTVSRTSVALGEGIQVNWRVTLEAGCEQMSVTVAGQRVAPAGSMVLYPQANAVYDLVVATWGDYPYYRRYGEQYQIAVTLPRQVTINANNQQALFKQAVGQPNTVVRLADHVNLNLTDYGEIPIAAGVQILGGRSSTKPGPRVYNTAPHSQRFLIVGHPARADNVRISGIRIDGGNYGIADKDAPTPIGLSVFSSVNVEISNNEILGWAGIGVEILDPDGRINLDNASAVRLSGNYVHHNRHYRSEGYGIATDESAYALIENNVFNYNRHALESSGLPGTGYLAYRNLVLRQGGQNSSLGTHTHMLDVHGTKDCGGYGSYCGPAGEYFRYEENTVLYEIGTGIKVRGKPSLRADAVRNVFAHSREWEGPTPLLEPGAMYQTEGANFYDLNNTFGQDSYTVGRCDFDGNGQLDNFLATGATWWYETPLGWFYLNKSRAKIGDVTLADVDGNGRCDVRIKADGVVFYGGKTAGAPRTDLLWRGPNGGRVWQVRNGAIQRDMAGFQDPTTTGDFNGDGISDVLYRMPDGKIRVYLLNSSGELAGDIGPWSSQRGSIPAETLLAGVGDFDGDARADLLWQHANRQLEIWYAAEPGNTAPLVDADGAAVVLPAGQTIKGVGDFNADGNADVLRRSDINGQASIWRTDGQHVIAESAQHHNSDSRLWKVQGVADFDADGYADILWRHYAGNLAIWPKGLAFKAGYPTYNNQPGGHAGNDWQVKGVGDFNADGRADILWRHDTGPVAIWAMNNSTYLGDYYLPQNKDVELVAVMPVYQYTPGTVLPPVPPGSKTVPNVLHQSYANAAAAIQAEGLVVGDRRYIADPTCNDIDAVLSQQPSGGTPVPAGSAVNLTLGDQPPTECP